MAQSRRIALPAGTVLNAVEAGSGPALLMIPGWSQSAAEYGRNIEELAQGRRVIALDMRSHGESPHAASGHRIYEEHEGGSHFMFFDLPPVSMPRYRHSFQPSQSRPEKTWLSNA